MKKIILMLSLIVLLAACDKDEFTAVDPKQAFIASVNILQPSITFYDERQQQLAKWPLEKAYSGAILVGGDELLLYGHQLDTIDCYQLSTGKKRQSIETGSGITNAYYDEASAATFVTNSKTNEVMKYNDQWELVASVKTGNYPMSMDVDQGKLYVVNYKDTTTTVIDIASFEIQQQWPVEKSSHGLKILAKQQEIWLGGHGQGSSPNNSVDVYDIATKEKLREIELPLMPIGFADRLDEIAIVSHGENMLSVLEPNGNLKWQLQVGANPFAVSYFQDQIVVAGYDDATLYFIKNNQILNTVATEKGPFQLLVRE